MIESEAVFMSFSESFYDGDTETYPAWKIMVKAFLRGRAFEITKGMVEHPEFWEMDCQCNSCKEYN